MKTPDTVTRWSSIVDKCRHPEVPAGLCLALIWQESSGNRWAYNPEPRYRYLVNVKTGWPFRATSSAELASKDPPRDWPHIAGDRDQEWWAQQASWGLLQIMGAAARERGFKGGYLTELCDPEVNIKYGTLHYWLYASKSGQLPLEESLLRYNGGGNANYAHEVLEKLAVIQT